MGRASHKVPWFLAALGLGILLGIAPRWSSAMGAAAELKDLRHQYEAMMKTITVTWPNSSKTTYYGCSDYVKSDNGTISFTGRKGSDTAAVGDYVLGHGQYAEVEVITAS